MAWIITDTEGDTLKEYSSLIKPEGFTIPKETTAIHGITTERALAEGRKMSEVIKDFLPDFMNSSEIVAHNYYFDMPIIASEIFRSRYKSIREKSKYLTLKPHTCTMLESVDFCQIYRNYWSDEYKWPKLKELHYKLFDTSFDNEHDALSDVRATTKCYFELRKRGIIE